MRTELLESELYDTVTTGSSCEDFIFVGTYEEVSRSYTCSLCIFMIQVLLVYSMADALRPGEAFPIARFNVSAPILSIAFLPTTNMLFVLSTKGFHEYVIDASRGVSLAATGRITTIKDPI